MNSKLSRILLLVAAIIVWGLIVYKVIVSFSDNKTSEAIIKNNSPAASTKQMPDTFSLLLNYADPFLSGGFEAKQETPRPAVQTISTPPKPVDETAKMSPVKYYGLITNKKTQKLVAIVNIGGKQYLAKQGNIINEITILKMTNDSILITYGHAKKWIHK